MLTMFTYEKQCHDSALFYATKPDKSSVPYDENYEQFGLCSLSFDARF